MFDSQGPNMFGSQGGFVETSVPDSVYIPHYGGTTPSFKTEWVATYDPCENYLERSVFVPRARAVFNYQAILLNLFAPVVIYAIVSANVSFEFHYQYPWCCYSSTLILGLVPSIYTGRKAILTRRRTKGSVGVGDPNWYTYASLAFLIATCLALGVGSYNFFHYTERYYDFMDLNSYTLADPVKDSGATMMDAGAVYWSAGVDVNSKMAMGFKQHDMYCVSPIIKRDAGRLATYDFWAVGVNCCDKQFDCGDTLNPHARSSARYMIREHAPFFRLAVQQAEAAYNINAPHPIFFEWTVDPLTKIRMLYFAAWENWMWANLVYFCVNLCGVVCAIIVFAKMGRM